MDGNKNRPQVYDVLARVSQLVRDLFEANARVLKCSCNSLHVHLLQQATEIFRQTKRAVHFSFSVRMEGSTSCAPRFSSLSEEEKAASSLVCWKTFIVRSEGKMGQNTSGQATSLPVALFSVS